MSILQWHGHFTTWPFHGDMANYHDMVILLTPVHFLVLLNPPPLVLYFLTSFSRTVVLSYSHILALLSFSRILVPRVVLSNSSWLGFSFFLSSCIFSPRI